MSIKTKRDEFETQLLSVYPVNNTKLYGALDDALIEARDEGYDDGYEDGREKGERQAKRDMAARGVSEGALEAIQARYEYLKKSGQWQRETTGDLYVRGFEDAMKVLGLLPMVGP